MMFPGSKCQREEGYVISKFPDLLASDPSKVKTPPYNGQKISHSTGLWLLKLALVTRSISPEFPISR